MDGIYIYNNLYQFFKSFLEYLNHLIEFFSTFILFVSVLLIITQITGRLVFGLNNFMPWVWESIIIFNVWVTYLGASVLVKDNKHIALKTYTHFPSKIKSILAVFVNIIVLFTSCVVIMQVKKLVSVQLGTSFVTIPFLKRGHASAVVLIGFFIIFIYKFFDLIYFKKNKAGNS